MAQQRAYPPLRGRRGPEHGWYPSDLIDDAMLWFLDQGVRVGFALHALASAAWACASGKRARSPPPPLGMFFYVLAASWALALGSGSTFYGPEQAAFLGLGAPAPASGLLVAGHAGGFLGALAGGAMCDRVVAAANVFRGGLAALVPAALVRSAAAALVRADPSARGGLQVAVIQGAANVLENAAYAAATVAGEVWLVKRGAGAHGPVAALLAGIVLATLSGTWIVDVLGWSYTSPAEAGAILATLVLVVPPVFGWDPAESEDQRPGPRMRLTRARARAEGARGGAVADPAAVAVVAPVSVAMFSLGWVYATFWYPALLENAELEEYVPRAATFLLLTVAVSVGNLIAALASGPLPPPPPLPPRRAAPAPPGREKTSDGEEEDAAVGEGEVDAAASRAREVVEADRMFANDPQLRVLVVSALGMAGCLGVLLAFSPETSDEPALGVAFACVLGVALLFGASLASTAELRARAWPSGCACGLRTGMCAAAGRAAAAICVARAPTIGYYRICAFGVAYTLVLLLPCLELSHRGGARGIPPLALAGLLYAVVAPAFSDDRLIPFLHDPDQP